MQNFGPVHLIIIMAIVMIGLGLIFKGTGVVEPNVVGTQATTAALAPAKAVTTTEISKRADDLPPPIARSNNTLVEISLTTEEVVAEIAPGATYTYWTFNGTVPGPMLRVKEGDDVRITLNHGAGGGMHSHAGIEVKGFDTLAAAEAFLKTDVAYAETMPGHGGGTDHHAAEGHAYHSIDLHAVTGPGGGAGATQVGHDGPKTFQFKATHPGVYVYHCASAHVPTHIANGMYGLIIVEPKEGLVSVDKEFYIMQGEFYTTGSFDQKGHHEFSLPRLRDEAPTFFAFNGRYQALTGQRAMQAQVGDRIRMFVGVGSHIASNFHIIGEVIDKLYADGSITSAPLTDVQTTVIPAGGAVMIEFTVDVPGSYVLVDHTLTRSIDKGAIAELVVTGPENPELFKPIP